MRGGLTSCSQSARSEPRKGVWWREPLVWAAADTFDLVPGAALPLALYRERSVSGEAALAALNDNELTWEIIYTKPQFDRRAGGSAAHADNLKLTPTGPFSAIEYRPNGWGL